MSLDLLASGWSSRASGATRSSGRPSLRGGGSSATLPASLDEQTFNEVLHAFGQLAAQVSNQMSAIRSALI